MGNELRLFVPEFLEFRKKCKAQRLDIPFLFHCGETLHVGDKVDGNLFDAVLLNSKRIGHGYAIARHPLLMEIFKEKKIAIETCPISNEVLGLTSVIAGHHLPILLANDVPCTINSDNATFYKWVFSSSSQYWMLTNLRSSLSHDFYQAMIGSESMSLQGWKQLIKWSLEHSCMSPEELASVTAEWTKRWKEFCQWIVDEYGPRFEEWEPRPGRHWQRKSRLWYSFKLAGPTSITCLFVDLKLSDNCRKSHLQLSCLNCEKHVEGRDLQSFGYPRILDVREGRFWRLAYSKVWASSKEPYYLGTEDNNVAKIFVQL